MALLKNDTETSSSPKPRVCFDAEDKPPLGYYYQRESPQIMDSGTSFSAPRVHRSRAHRSTPLDPEEWSKAPEFVPRYKQQQPPTSVMNGGGGASPLSSNSSTPGLRDSDPMTTSLTAPLPPMAPFPSAMTDIRQLVRPFGVPHGMPFPGLLPPPLGGPLVVPPPPSHHRLPPPLPLPLQLVFNQHRPQTLFAAGRLPFKPAGLLPPTLLARPLSAGLPRLTAARIAAPSTTTVGGYGHGGAGMPTILLKRKRRKRNKKQKPRLNEPAVTPSPQDPDTGADATAPETTSLTPDEEDMRQKRDSSSVDADDDHLEQMSPIRQTSEPDLTRLQEASSSATDGGVGGGVAGGFRRLDLGDVDTVASVQSALDHGAAIFTGSCPDLSDAQRDIWDDFLLGRLDDPQLTAEDLPPEPGRPDEEPQYQGGIYINPADDQYQGQIYSNPLAGILDEHEEVEADQRCAAAPSSKYEYDVSGAAILTALQDVVSSDRIRSSKVRALDREIRSEMGMNMDDSLIVDHSGRLQNGLPNMNGTMERERSEDRLYSRLLHQQSSIVAAEARTPRSLFDELEDRQNFERAQIHSTDKQLSAVVQEPKQRHANAVVLDPKKNDRLSRRAIDSLFPPQTFVDDDIGMTVTINSFEDPEELAFSDEEDELCVENGKRANNFNRIKEAVHRRFNTYQTPALQGPPERVCCTLM